MSGARVAGRVLPLLLVAALAAREADAAPPAPVELEAPPSVGEIRVADVDGDGRRDLLLLSGRQVRVHAGRAGALPAPTPSMSLQLPEDATFVDVLPPAAVGPALLVLGTEGARAVLLEGGAERRWPGVDVRLAWADRGRARFADLVGGDGSLLLPTASGWRHWPEGPDGAALDLPLPPFREVRPPGSFLQDSALVVEAWPRVVRTAEPPGAGGGALLWTLAGTELVAFGGGGRVAWDLSFLPAAGERRLLDLDGDGVPEVVWREAGNREATYAVFAVPPPVWDAGRLVPTGRDVRPAAALLRLPGYNLDPAWVDVDGDGHLDLVVTTVPVDARNMMRALGGRVAAGTHVFRGRGRARGFFGDAPESSVRSDMDITVRFSAAGNIDVLRSYTIVAEGDFDGDGRKDLVIRTGADAIAWHRGRAGGGWAAEAATVPIPPLGGSADVNGIAADLTGDGRDELVLHYVAAPGGRDRIWVLGF